MFADSVGARVLRRKMAEDETAAAGRGRGKGKATSFSTYGAMVSGGGRHGPAATARQTEMHTHMRSQIPLIMETTGATTSQAFGRAASTFRTTQPIPSRVPSPVPGTSPIPSRVPSPVPGTPGNRAPSVERTPLKRLRSPSFLPNSERWRKTHCNFEHFVTRPRRKRTRETNETIVNTGQEWCNIQILTNPLIQGELLRSDYRHSGKLLSVRPKEERDTERGRRRNTIETSDASHTATVVDDRDNKNMGTFIRLPQAMTFEQWNSVQDVLRQSAAEAAATFVGVGSKYSSRVLGQFVDTGSVPPGDERGFGGRGRRSEVELGETDRLSRQTVQAVRMHVIDANRGGRPLTSTGIRAFIKNSHHIQLSRRELQRLRGRLGLVWGAMRGAEGAKESHRVRITRFRFVARRVEADSLEGAKKPLRAYSDESYVHANHCGTNTWGLSEKAWSLAIEQERQDLLSCDMPLPQASLAGLADEKGSGAAQIRVTKPKSGRGDRLVLVDMITECGRVNRTHNGQHVPVGKLCAAHETVKDYHGNFDSRKYMHWMDAEAVPGLIETSQQNDDRPIHLIIDKASYHITQHPTHITPSELKRPELLDMCELFDVTHEMLIDVAKLKVMPKLGPGEQRAVGADCQMSALSSFLDTLMPPQRNRVEILWGVRTKHLPRADAWCIDYEPSYHFELQATEHLWGIVKGDVSREPRYGLKGVMEAVNASLEKRCTPALCMSLVNECRKWETSFYKTDLATFGDNGDDTDTVCGASFCPLAAQMSKVGAAGEAARAAELRLCAGACGYYFQQRCVHSTPLVSDAWPRNSKICRCGCADASLSDSEDVDAGSDCVGDVDDDRDGLQRERDRESHAQKIAGLMNARHELSSARTGGAKKHFSSTAR